MDKVSEEVEVGKKESGIKQGRKKKADSKRGACRYGYIKKQSASIYVWK